jgi:hypothetical protein
MNPLLNPTNRRPGKPNIENVRKLVKSEKPALSQVTDSRLNLPTNWMDGDSAMKKLWNDIKSEETVSRLHRGEINPF